MWAAEGVGLSSFDPFEFMDREPPEDQQQVNVVD
jgi:hypothetical protein